MNVCPGQPCQRFENKAGKSFAMKDGSAPGDSSKNPILDTGIPSDSVLPSFRHAPQGKGKYTIMKKPPPS